MSFEITGIGLTVLISIVLHGFSSVWWASKITSEIWHINKSIDLLGKELIKRDDQISALWKKVDNLSGRVSAIETRCKIQHIDKDAV